MPFSITIMGFGSKNEIFNKDIERYVKLVYPYAKISFKLLKHQSGNLNRNELLLQEEKALYTKWPKHSYSVALSEEGKQFDSISFSKWLSTRIIAGIPLLFIIGGAYGLSETLKKKCREVISLSSMTLPYKICYLVLIEQIYRAFTILKRHPYHK